MCDSSLNNGDHNSLSPSWFNLGEGLFYNNIIQGLAFFFRFGSRQQTDTLHYWQGLLKTHVNAFCGYLNMKHNNNENFENGSRNESWILVPQL